jgi:tetratricopeptide (TPR) repeat protein
VARGLSADRDQRFPSMDALLAAMGRGQARVRRLTIGIAAGVAAVLACAGAFGLGASRHVSCIAPTARIAAVWPAGEASPRRQAVHRAFAASGLPTAEAAWQRVASALDVYTAQWSAMYVDACQATHVRGDQSAEVLDLRMGCLNETLDGVRALTEVLSHADARMAGQAATAAQELAPLGRCADVGTLRSAVPPPRDQATANAVAEVRSALRDVSALSEVGNDRAALAKAREILPRAEATHYKPLIAEVLNLTGLMLCDGAPADAEGVLEQALAAAEAGHDDLMAANAVISLVYATSFARDKRHEWDLWTKLAHALVDRLPQPQPRLRAWLANNEAMSWLQRGEFETARALLEQALAIKEQELGKDHPDVVRSTIGLVWVLNELGRSEQALPLADRGIEIVGARDTDSVLMAYMLNNRGDSLSALRRFVEAEQDYRSALRIMKAQLGERSYRAAVPIVGIAGVKLGEGNPEAAVRNLEEALGLQEGHDPDDVLVADTRFALARALTAAGKDRPRARTLATSARDVYASHDEPRKQRKSDDWLTDHGGSGKP